MPTRILAAAAVVAGLAFSGTALAVTRSDPGSSESHGSAVATLPAADASPGPDDSTGFTGAPSTPDDTPTTPEDTPTTPDDNPNFSGNMPPAGAAIGADRAVEIALARVGSGRVVKVEREFEHGRRVWSVRIDTAGREVRVDVDSSSGAIVRLRTDAFDDRAGDDHGGGRDDRTGDDHGGGRDDRAGDDRRG